MRFEPKTAAEINASKMKLKEGPANFEIIKAEDTFSKHGNEMIKLTLRVWDCEGKWAQIFDYLVSNVPWKMLQFLNSISRPEIYETGVIDVESLLGASGGCVIKIQRDNSGVYGDRLVIAAYQEKARAEPQEKQNHNGQPADSANSFADDILDDISFNT